MKAHDFISLQLLLLPLLSLAYFAQTAEPSRSTETIATSAAPLIVAPEVETASALSGPSGAPAATEPALERAPVENNNDLGAIGSPADSAALLSGANATRTDEEDVVISSSEILADSRPPAATNQRRDSADANCTAELQDCALETKFVTVDTDQRDSSSRTVLKLLMVGLFVLVSLSLAFVYTIKFCLCGRRKRHLALRRDLVGGADHPAAPTHPCPQLDHRQFLPECPCGLQRPSSSRAAGRLHTLLRPSMWGLCRDSLDSTCHLPRQTLPSLYQQLALADRLQQLGGTGYPGLGCHSCLIDLQCRATGAQSAPLGPQPEACAAGCPTGRPPAYSELFGAGPQAPQPEGALAQCRAAAVDEEAGCDFAAETSAGGDRATELPPADLAEPSQGQVDSRNLLVKLNLNKTKLLSAGDLVLLSRLIDVPIVVQEQQQRRLPQADDEDRTRGPATIEQEADEGRPVGADPRPEAV